MIGRFVHLMHISLEHIGAPLEVGTKISVFWKEDDDWHNGLIDAYDPISNVHGVLYFDGEREELILEDEIFQIVSYPRPLADMIYQYSDVLSTLSVCLLQGDNLGESRAGRFSLLLHLNELLYLMRRSRKKQICVVASPGWGSMMSIVAVSSSSKLCSSSSDSKEDLIEAMFLLLCVFGGCLGAPKIWERFRGPSPKKRPPNPQTPKSNGNLGVWGPFFGKIFFG